MIATIKLINIHYLYLVTISYVCVCVYVCVNRWIFTTPVSFPVPSTGQEVCPLYRCTVGLRLATPLISDRAELHHQAFRL